MPRTEARHSLLWGAVFGVLATVLLWSRIVGLDLSFWHDEVVTVVRYAGAGPRAIFLGPYIPNNHVLFSLLAWGTTRVLGKSEVIYRLWGLLPALIATGWLTWWACRRFGRLAGAAVLALMTVSPVLLQVSREARGYGLALLAIVGLITQADSALREPERHAVWRFVAFGTIGVLTLPVFVLPFLFASLPLLIVSRLRLRLMIGVAISGAVSLVWFAPMLGEIIANSTQQFGRPIPWHGALTLSMSQLVFPVFRLLPAGNPDILLTYPPDSTGQLLVWHLVAWLLVGVAGFTLWRRHQRLLLLVLVLPVLGTYTVLAGMGAWAADRHVSYLSVPLFVLVGLGVRGARELIALRLHTGMYLVFAALLSWIVVSFYPVADQVVHVPMEAFKEVASTVSQHGAQRTVTNSVRPEGLEYYLPGQLEVMSSEDLQRLFCGLATNYTFIHHPVLAPDVDTACLAAKGSHPVRFTQRGRGRWIDVWFVDAPAE